LKAKIGSRPQNIHFAVRLTPKGGRDAIEGWAEGADAKRYLKACVAAPPEDGKANAALVRLIAAALDIGPSKVKIVEGAASRMKTVEVDGEPSRLAVLGKIA
jgi:uncharacterized protein YggU (UPF0235/DUF167 family)